jgi:hypothetical protein
MLKFRHCRQAFHRQARLLAIESVSVVTSWTNARVVIHQIFTDPWTTAMIAAIILVPTEFVSINVLKREAALAFACIVSN